MNIKFLPVAVALLFLSAGSAVGQTDTQVVTIVVSNINVIALSSGTLTLTINTATAGSNPTNATSSATTYAITTNGSAKKITGELGTAYASGISLALNLGAPTGATSVGSTVLTTTAQNLVTGISGLAESSLGVAYTASATAAVASNAGGEAQTVTLTITD